MKSGLPSIKFVKCKGREDRMTTIKNKTENEQQEMSSKIKSEFLGAKQRHDDVNQIFLFQGYKELPTKCTFDKRTFQNY